MFISLYPRGEDCLHLSHLPDCKAKVWPLYDLEDKNMMVFDEFDIHPEKESDLKIVERDRTYFLTRYCVG